MNMRRIVTDFGMSNFRSRVRHSMQRVKSSASWPEELIIVSSALFVGLGTGLGAVIFIWLFRQIYLAAQASWPFQHRRARRDWFHSGHIPGHGPLRSARWLHD